MLPLIGLLLFASVAQALDCDPTQYGFPASHVLAARADHSCTFRRPDGQFVTLAFALDDPTTTQTDDHFDGFIYGQSTSYGTAQTTATAALDTTTSFYVGQIFTGGAFFVERGFLEFDLSAITAGASISTSPAPQLSMKTGAAGYAVGVNAWNVIVREYPFTTPIGNSLQGNFDGCIHAATSANDQMWTDSTNMAVSTTYTVSLPHTAWLNIGVGASPTGYCLFSSRDQSQLSPGTGEERVLIQSNESGANAPSLVVVWSAGGPTATPTGTETPTGTATPLTTPTRLPTFTGGTPPRCGEITR